MVAILLGGGRSGIASGCCNEHNAFAQIMSWMGSVGSATTRCPRLRAQPQLQAPAQGGAPTPIQAAPRQAADGWGHGAPTEHPGGSPHEARTPMRLRTPM